MRTAPFPYLEQRGADFLIAVKNSPRKGFQVIRDRLTHGGDFQERCHSWTANQAA